MKVKHISLVSCQIVKLRAFPLPFNLALLSLLITVFEMESR